MRVHYKKIDKVLQEFPAQSEKWQMWLEYHKFQLAYFQANRDNYVQAANVFLLIAVFSLAMAASFQASFCWWLALVAGCIVAGLEYYLSIYNVLMHQMEEQTEKLFEKTVAIETKPNLTVAKHVLDIAGGLVSGWSAWLKARNRNAR